jgi:hypothetical protein
MLKMLLQFVSIFTLVSGVQSGIAQTAVLSSGISKISQPGGSVTYSVGQLFFNEISQTSAKIEEGVQHANEIYVVNVYDDDSSDSVLKVYPNPFTNYLIVEIMNIDHLKMHYRMDDVFGNICIEGDIENRLTKIDLSALYPAIYLLEVYADQSRLKTWIILKQ